MVKEVNREPIEKDTLILRRELFTFDVLGMTIKDYEVKEHSIKVPPHELHRIGINDGFHHDDNDSFTWCYPKVNFRVLEYYPYEDGE